MIELQPAFARIGDGERIYAIGDIHGRVDRLSEIHNKIVADLDARPIRDPTVVYLGDYIDRGPDSASVLDLMVSPPPKICEIKRIHLIGNHEAFCLEAYYGNDDAEADWLENGGADCLQSWRLSADNWRAMAPPEHIEFLRGLELKHIQGGYMFVHAGIRPMVGIDDQNPDDLLWIREAFLDDEGPHPFVVVHGHTPESMRPRVRYNRIGMDTGAAYGGPLSCLVLESDQMGFLVTKSDAEDHFHEHPGRGD